MLDHLGRKMTYLRLSVTDRCNFRCTYCMPAEGLPLLPCSEYLSDEEILRLIRCLAQLGLAKVRLTGGEPLLRPGLTELVRQIKAIPAIQEVAITTNGSLLEGMAKPLHQAGLDRVNISLDTGNEQKFRQITRCGRLIDTLQGIKAAQAAGLTPIKVNAVLTSQLDESDLCFFANLLETGMIVRFIEVMPLGEKTTEPGFSVEQVRDFFYKFYKQPLVPVEIQGKYNGPARYWKIPGVAGRIGFITPISEHFCHSCNRLRLTADGKLRFCLLSDLEQDLKPLLRSGASEHCIMKELRNLINLKPEGHHLAQVSDPILRKMSQIGG